MATSNFDDHIPEPLKGKIEGFKSRKTLPRTEQAQEFFDEFFIADDGNGGIPFHYIYEYIDHEDTYTDKLFFDFKYWYEDHEDALAHKRYVLEVACMAIDFTMRPNHTAQRPSTEGLIRSFNDDGNNRVTSSKPQSSLIPYDKYGALVARLINVAYRKVFTADGAKLFLTQPRGFNPYCCPNCETEFKGRFIYELGPEGVQHGHDNLTLRGNANAWPVGDDDEESDNDGSGY